MLIPETNEPKHEVYYSEHGLKEFVQYLDASREKLIDDTIGYYNLKKTEYLLKWRCTIIWVFLKMFFPM